ncbi:MAG: response regulator transcription factor [Sphingomonadaceae bacterium]
MEHRITLHVIDSSSRIRAELSRLAFELGHHAEVYSDLAELIDHPPRDGIIIARDDALDGGVSVLLERLAEAGIWLPLVVSGLEPSIGRVVEAVKAGALDYLHLPADERVIALTLQRIGTEAVAQADARRRMVEARNRISHLSNREREVLDCLANGGSNKAIGRVLHISPRTVEIHRANMMGKLGAKHASEAVRLRLESQLESVITKEAMMA